MSISDEIASRVEDGNLFPVRPHGHIQRRWIFLVKGLHEEIENPRVGEEERLDELHADLVSFLFLRKITPEFLWLLSPKTRGVWEIKSRRDEPQIRVFGQFAMKNVFIAMSYQYRFELGEITNPVWELEIGRAVHTWRQLFSGAYTPLKTSDQHQLFTGAIDAKYFKD